jgi:hypothetical protein
MRHLIIILLTFLTMPVHGQLYSFEKNFVNGTIILKDSTKLAGQLKWFPSQNERIKFKENGNTDVKKYSPEDLIGFTVDSMNFVSLFDLEVYSDNYVLFGKTSKIKHTFGQLYDSGSFNIYFVLISGYDAISSTSQTYPNFYFEKKIDKNSVCAAYPFALRMRDKKYEKAKENLYVFFKDNQQIIERIRAYKKEDNFFEIIDLLKKAN